MFTFLQRAFLIEMEVDRASDNESSSGDEEEMELEKQVTELEAVVRYTLLYNAS